MNITRRLGDFVKAFAVTLVVSGIVTLLGNFIVHGTPTIDWGRSFGLAILFGITLPWIASKRNLGTTFRRCDRR
jgi:hypothetical protein